MVFPFILKTFLDYVSDEKITQKPQVALLFDVIGRLGNGQVISLVSDSR
jgi:hypothetical protein